MKLVFLVGRMIPEKCFIRSWRWAKAWRVRRVDYVEKESKVLIRVEETPALWPTESCPHCRPSRWAATTMRRNGAGGISMCASCSRRLCARCRVANVKACQKVYTVRAPGRDAVAGLTQEFEAFALTLMREMPVQQGGGDFGGDGSEVVAGAFCACGRGVGGVELGECGLGGRRRDEPEEGA